MKRRSDQPDPQGPPSKEFSMLAHERDQPLPERPRSLGYAMKLMYLGAALTLVGIVYGLFNTAQTRAGVIQRDAQRTGGARLGPGEVDAAVRIAIGVSVAAGIFGMCLWIAMAVLNGQGRKWARMVATVLCAFSAVSFIYGVAAVVAARTGFPSLAVRGLNLAIGLGAIAFMYRSTSNEYYDACWEVRSAEQIREYG